MKNVAISYFKQTLFLGTLGFLIFQVIGWLSLGRFFWASDNLEVWFLSLFAVAAYLLLIGTPVIWLINKLQLQKWLIVLSCFSGLITVFIYLFVFGRREPSFYNYFIWPWNMYLIFGVIGLLFGLSYIKHKNA